MVHGPDTPHGPRPAATVGPDFTKGVRDALGSRRVDRLGELSVRAHDLSASVADAWTTEFWVTPMGRSQAEAWRRSASRRREDWAFVTLSGGGMLAVDEIPDRAHIQPAEAVTFPAIQSQLSAWWLFHAWRGADFVTNAISDIASWRMTTAPLLARALIEQTGCLVYECRKLFRAWSEAKSGDAVGVARAELVNSHLQPLLAKTTMGTRVSGSPERLQAPNVLTYVQTITKVLKDDRYQIWYDWLSDASHPAFGARIACASEPMAHESRAVVVRFLSRGLLSSVRVDQAGRINEDSMRPQFNEIASHVADSVGVSANAYFSALAQARKLVDDFALTTRASALTLRHLWPAPTPATVGEDCPCGCGALDLGDHRWGRPAPVLKLEPITPEGP